MKRHRKSARTKTATIHAWTYPQAQKALPYLTSILHSVREHRLEALQYDRQVRRLDARPGRPDRASLIETEEARHAARRAEARFEEALRELHGLSVYCLDPVRGEALIPFVHDSQLAWYCLDLFDEQPLRFWRFHVDPLEMRRPIGDTLGDKAAVVV